MQYEIIYPHCGNVVCDHINTFLAVSCIQKANAKIRIISRQGTPTGNYWNVGNLLPERYYPFGSAFWNPGTDCSLLRCRCAGVETKFVNQHSDRNGNLYGTYTAGVLMTSNIINLMPVLLRNQKG